MGILPCRTTVIFEVHADDLERVIRQEYPTLPHYSFVLDQECGENTITVAWGIHLHPTYQKKLDDVLRKNVKQRGGYVTGALLHDLCRQGKIPEGTYRVRVRC